MEVVGYADRLSVAPGETLRFYVSCQQPTYQADIVRLIHGDPNPKGPGFKEELVSTPVSSEYPGRRQDIHTGSHIIVPDAPPLRLADGFTLYAWIYATTPQKGVQGILTKWSEVEGGYGLVLDEGGVLAAWLTDPAGRTERVRINTPLRAAEWYLWRPRLTLRAPNSPCIKSRCARGHRTRPGRPRRLRPSFRPPPRRRSIV